MLDFYASKTGQWLSELARAEQPWQAARQLDTENSLTSMAEYYTAPY